MTVKYVPAVPVDPPETSKVTQWSFGIAMFAAFVVPFVLMASSARYRVFVAQAKHKFQAFSQTSQVDYQPKDVKHKKTKSESP